MHTSMRNVSTCRHPDMHMHTCPHMFMDARAHMHMPAHMPMHGSTHINESIVCQEMVERKKRYIKAVSRSGAVT